MTQSTGNNGRSAAKKSTTAAATGDESAEMADGPVGGVLPAKKTALPPRQGAPAKPVAAERTASDAAKSGSANVGGGGARTGSTTSGTTKADGTGRSARSTSGAKATSPAAPARKTGATKAATPPKLAAPGQSSPTATAGAWRSAKSADQFGADEHVAAARKAVPTPRAASAGKTWRPVPRVRRGRNWGRIPLYVLTGMVAVAIVFLGAWPSISAHFQQSWQQRAAKISGIHNYLQTNPEWFTYDPNTGNQQPGNVTYPIYPPVGGMVNPQWQDCMGEVYGAQIPNEQAAHSLENGAVWIAYRPGLPQDQIAKLASKVQGKQFMMMSPYPNLDSPISLQAWGYQLKVDNAGDKRIDDFINALRGNAGPSSQTGCSGGITDTGTAPLDLPGLGG
jgi:hypothetical protein